MTKHVYVAPRPRNDYVTRELDAGLNELRLVAAALHGLVLNGVPPGDQVEPVLAFEIAVQLDGVMDAGDVTTCLRGLELLGLAIRVPGSTDLWFPSVVRRKQA